VSEFVFFPSKYSQIRSLDDKKIGRLQKIAMEAIEQCGRSDIVTLSLSS
jgi:16S rRNA U1498 N3-methylase RsmE